MGNAEMIRASLPCSVEMPAGTGKTETIGELVKLFADDGKRSLVLTHTHAGVDVLRRRMKKFGVPKAAVTIRTLDSWCFDLIGSFPDLSGITVDEEPDWAQSKAYHVAGAHASSTTAVSRMLRASYDLLVVDEYQDCQLWQHRLVAAVSESVPTCVLGDRMQGLFFWGDAKPVIWETDVEPLFAPLALNVYPWRWASANPALGEWLLQARLDLMTGTGIDLSGSPISIEPPSRTRDVLFGMPAHPSTTVAISRNSYTAATLAAQLAGAFTMIEELEGRHLRAFAQVLDEKGGPAIAAATATYAVECAFGVALAINTKARASLESGMPISAESADPDVRRAVGALNGLLHEHGYASVRSALLALSTLPSFRLFRREAWFGMLDALRLAEATDDLSALAGVVAVRNKMRMTGRRPESRVVGRALLVKGLEFDHAVIDAPGKYPYNAHELYVCLTRGATSVTLMTNDTKLTPQRPTRSE